MCWQYPGPMIESGARVLHSILLEPMYWVYRQQDSKRTTCDLTNDSFFLLKKNTIYSGITYCARVYTWTNNCSLLPEWTQVSKWTCIKRVRSISLMVRCSRVRAMPFGSLHFSNILFGHLPDHKAYYAHCSGLNAAITPFEIFLFAINKYLVVTEVSEMFGTN